MGTGILTIPSPGSVWDAELARRKHPGYDELYNKLRFGRESYEGTGGYAPWLDEVRVSSTQPDDQKAGTMSPNDRRTYLFKHSREEKKFDRRVMMAYPSNVIKRALQALVGFVTVKRPDYLDFGTDVDNWRKAVNDQGDSWEVMKEHEIFPQVCYYGFLPVLFRRDESPDAKTKAQQKPLHAEVINPETILDWKDGPHGQFEWFKTKVKVDTTQPEDEKRSSVDRYTYFTQAGYWVVDDDKTSTELPVRKSGTYADGMPIVVWTLRGGALTGDANAVQRELYNVNSLVQEQERETAFAMLAIQDKSGGKPTPGLINTGTDNVIRYDGDKEPMWLAPPATVLEHLMHKREVLGAEILETMGLDFDRGGGQTGMAFQFKMSKIVRQLQGLANSFSRSDSACMRRVAKEIGAPKVPDKARVEYPREFDARDVDKLRELLKDVMDRVNSKTGRVLAQVRLFELAMRGHLKDGEEEDVRKEVERDTPKELTPLGQLNTSAQAQFGAHGDGADGTTEATEDKSDDTRAQLKPDGGAR